ncbi:unnamed protein product [Arctia plantaginis]|uniref:BTB domain-containing protein n=1 Tax=Arctia plantaginis TaxID=874455 RepID=A0A8S1AI85_ARCPL|nr:unnamed protein product [Arctia plantaginis]CAB3247417.1 unnamed protein product [Arctia plantaginis]
MAQSQFSLMWNAHKKNICNGLSTLQQNGEFVDMTLAADGHLVKVHQVIIALASSYIKDLISTAQCPHPVIFLNKISYTTLSAILEYVYTGEVLVSIENLNDFLQAGKELHIKGLEDMKIHDSLNSSQNFSKNDNDAECSMDTLNDEICYFEISNKDDDDSKYVEMTKIRDTEGESTMVLSTNDDNLYTDGNDDDSMTDVIKAQFEKQDGNFDKNYSVMQYTVSNQGSLQMILNRYVYYLKHTNRNNSRQWRCVDYLNNIKCPAHVITKDDVVIQRISAHVHPFHDKKILKKVRAGTIFSAINEAVQEGKNKKNQNNDE